MYHGISILIRPNMLYMRNISSLRLRAHTLKVEAAAWLEGGSRICDQYPGKDGHSERGACSFILPRSSSL